MTPFVRIPMPLPPDTPTAREELTRELLSPAYAGMWWDWFQGWLADRLMVDVGDGTLGTALLVGLLLLLVAVAVAVGVTVVRRRRRDTHLVHEPVFDGERAMSAQDYRRRAEEHSRAGRHDEAYLDRYRAVGAGAVARGIVLDTPDLTASEVSRALAVAFPDHEQDARRAGASFDRIRYGGAHAQAQDVDLVTELDQALESREPVRARPFASTSAVPR